MLIPLLGGTGQFIIGPFIVPSVLTAAGLGYFAVSYIKANSYINKERSEVQESIIRKATIVTKTQVYNVACAGSDDSSSCEKVESVDVAACNFCDNSGASIDVALYHCFVVKGNSMKYAGINEDDFLFVPKALDLSFLSKGSFPEIIVLRYRNPIEGKARYKVRRAWYVGTLDENFQEIAANIIDSDKFSCLKHEHGFQNKQWMLDDLKERLATYRRVYSDSLEEHKKVILSTTFDTKNEKIHFSIHPVSAIVGKVELSYTVK